MTTDLHRARGIFRMMLGLLCGAIGSMCSAEDGTAGETAARVVFLGDSLTAGYGIDPNDAFPARVSEMIEAAELPFEIVNAGLSGDTSAGGLRRLNWLFRSPVDVLVIAVGSNDGLRGFDLEATRGNLHQIVTQVRSTFPSADIVLAGLQVPPNLGPEYSLEFKSIFFELAETENLTLIPFLLEGVAAVRELNQADGMHPNEKGHKIVADTVWKILRPVLEARVESERKE